MLFNSFEFIFLFVPLVLLVSTPLKGNRLLAWIGLSSVFFYAFAGHPWFLIPMLVTTILDFLIAPVMDRQESQARRRALLLVSLCGNLGLLFYFKYAGFFLSSATGAWRLLTGGTGDSPRWFDVFKVVLPAGISFYTFQTLSYVLDVYWRRTRPELNFWKFVSFVSFFPHLVAGPLTRHHQLLPPLARIAALGIRPRWEAGLYLFAVGLAKKVLFADRIAEWIDPILAHIGSADALHALLALLGYTLQIYFDFSGYSDMAIGLGRLFGIELPVNFNSPYQAASPSDFWKRWHITLSSWLRDYLYIPLGGNRGSEKRRDLNLMATMAFGGLWHGANWTFVIWGVYHGLLLVVFKRLKAWNHLPLAIQQAGMFGLVTLGWLPFRAESPGQAWTWLSSLLGSQGLLSGALSSQDLKLMGAVAVGLAVSWFSPNAATFRRFESLRVRWRLALGATAGIAVVAMSQSSKFLYFQF